MRKNSGRNCIRSSLVVSFFVHAHSVIQAPSTIARTSKAPAPRRSSRRAPSAGCRVLDPVHNPQKLPTIRLGNWHLSGHMFPVSPLGPDVAVLLATSSQWLKRMMRATATKFSSRVLRVLSQIQWSWRDVRKAERDEVQRGLIYSFVCISVK